MKEQKLRKYTDQGIKVVGAPEDLEVSIPD